MALLTTLCAAGVGCSDVAGPGLDAAVHVEVAVSGGIAGVSYSFELDGPDGVVRGVTCTSGCDFEAGRVFVAVSPTQVARTAGELREAGIFALNGVDFGTVCCDQFQYVVTYREDGRTSTVRGDAGTLPPLLLRAVGVLQGMVDGRLPVVVALDTDPQSYPSDPLTLEEAAISGDVLEAAVHYGGGCRLHEIDLVAFHGWLESAPVQVDVLLSHEDNGDMCDALIMETRRFDLRPLAEAYRDAYGGGAPGETTLVLRLREPGQPGQLRLLEYRF
ncbi:MAG: hypothetical protein R3253_10205 [Longimicrobiales bacterium]|nr:hypothetical protein [Longimicrobiales bacterium]